MSMHIILMRREKYIKLDIDDVKLSRCHRQKLTAQSCGVKRKICTLEVRSVKITKLLH